MPSQFETLRPQQRLVFLGASNLTRSFPTAVETALALFDRPLSMFVAMGHGRSYGQDSCCLGKKTSGIFQCGIWQALEKKNPAPTTAWITDIGNDLAYEVPVETVLEWIRACVDRLLAMGAQVVLCDLPLESLRRTSATKYRCFRALLFPSCRLDFEEMLHRAEQLSEGLRELANERKTPIFSAPIQWYGFDPIHPRSANYATIWRELLMQSSEVPSHSRVVEKSFPLRCYLRCLRPQRWSCCSIARRTIQPNGRLQDATEIALY